MGMREMAAVSNGVTSMLSAYMQGIQMLTNEKRYKDGERDKELAIARQKVVQDRQYNLQVQAQQATTDYRDQQEANYQQGFIRSGQQWDKNYARNIANDIQNNSNQGQIINNQEMSLQYNKDIETRNWQAKQEALVVKKERARVISSNEGIAFNRLERLDALNVDQTNIVNAQNDRKIDVSELNAKNTESRYNADNRLKILEIYRKYDVDAREFMVKDRINSIGILERDLSSFTKNHENELKTWDAKIGRARNDEQAELLEEKKAIAIMQYGEDYKVLTDELTNFEIASRISPPSVPIAEMPNEGQYAPKELVPNQLPSQTPSENVPVQNITPMFKKGNAGSASVEGVSATEPIPTGEITTDQAEQIEDDQRSWFDDNDLFSAIAGEGHEVVSFEDYKGAGYTNDAFGAMDNQRNNETNALQQASIDAEPATPVENYYGDDLGTMGTVAANDPNSPDLQAMLDAPERYPGLTPDGSYERAGDADIMVNSGKPVFFRSDAEIKADEVKAEQDRIQTVKDKRANRTLFSAEAEAKYQSDPKIVDPIDTGKDIIDPKTGARIGITQDGSKLRTAGQGVRRITGNLDKENPQFGNWNEAAWSDSDYLPELVDEAYMRAKATNRPVSQEYLNEIGSRVKLWEDEEMTETSDQTSDNKRNNTLAGIPIAKLDVYNKAFKFLETEMREGFWSMLKIPWMTESGSGEAGSPANLRQALNKMKTKFPSLSTFERLYMLNVISKRHEVSNSFEGLKTLNPTDLDKYTEEELSGSFGNLKGFFVIEEGQLILKRNRTKIESHLP